MSEAHRLASPADMAIDALRAIDPGDPEAAASKAFRVLCTLLPDNVLAEYDDLVAKARWWPI